MQHWRLSTLNHKNIIKFAFCNSYLYFTGYYICCSTNLGHWWRLPECCVQVAAGFSAVIMSVCLYNLGHNDVQTAYSEGCVSLNKCNPILQETFTQVSGMGEPFPGIVSMG